MEDILFDNPVIAAIKGEEELESVINSSCSVVFVLYGTILNIIDISKKLKDNNKIVFVHIDLIQGLKGDHAGIEFIKSFAKIDGIITTKPANIKYARQNGLYTIQRVFIVDSMSFDTGIKSVSEVMPNAVEVMPGIATKIIKDLKGKIDIPIIAGGLIKTKGDIIESLSAGASAVSTTKQDLWNI